MSLSRALVFEITERGFLLYFYLETSSISSIKLIYWIKILYETVRDEASRLNESITRICS